MIRTRPKRVFLFGMHQRTEYEHRYIEIDHQSGDIDECGDGVIDGMPCERMQGGANARQVDDTTYCTCPGGNEPKWVCIDPTDFGQGGADGGGVTCPANPKTGDACTGLGLCPGSTTCGCGLGSVYCGGQ